MICFWVKITFSFSSLIFWYYELIGLELCSVLAHSDLLIVSYSVFEKFVIDLFLRCGISYICFFIVYISIVCAGFDQCISFIRFMHIFLMSPLWSIAPLHFSVSVCTSWLRYVLMMSWAFFSLLLTISRHYSSLSALIFMKSFLEMTKTRASWSMHMTEVWYGELLMQSKSPNMTLPSYCRILTSNDLLSACRRLNMVLYLCVVVVRFRSKSCSTFCSFFSLIAFVTTNYPYFTM